MRKGFGILLVGIILIIASIGNATIRFGEDATGQEWIGDDGSLITNTNGKAWDATHTNIQLALWDLNSTGGEVYVPDGTFTGTAIRMVNNTKLRGNGNNTKIVSEGGTDANCINITSVNNIEICYLYLDGNRSNQADHARGILIAQNDNSWKTENILIHNCVIAHTYRDGIEAYPSTELLTIRDNYFYDCGEIDTNYEGAITSRGRYTVIAHNYIQDSLGYGVIIETTSSPARRRAGYAIIDSNIMEGTNLSGVHLEGGDSSFWCTVTNNVIRNVTSTLDTGNANGITACGSNTTIANNIIENVIGKGIAVDAAGNELINNVSVCNNVIVNVDTYDGIFVRAENCVVEGNVIYDTVRTGIFCYGSDCNNITINDNSISTANTGGTDAGGVYIDSTCGTGFTVSGNSITNTQAKGIRGNPTSIISNNRITDMAESGGTEYCIYHGGLISNNFIHNGLEYGIRAGASSVITGNVIDTVTSDGIYATTDDSLISNNFISNCANEDIDDDGNDNIKINNILSGVLTSSHFVFPTTAPNTPTIGSAFLNLTTSELSIYNGTNWIVRNSGTEVNVFNGTWIEHGLPGDPDGSGSITVSLRGSTTYNATRILRVPTILQSNATHFQIEFTMWETVGWTQVPVLVGQAQTIYWDAVYRGV